MQRTDEGLLTDAMWASRKWLRERRLIPDYSRIGVPWIMTATRSYVVIVIALPALIVSAIVWWMAGFVRGLIALPIMLILTWLAQFFFMQN